MAIYGVDFYGSTTYGYLPPTQFKAFNFVGVPESYDKVILSWGLPGGSWDRIYLVRSSFEFVSSPGDGAIIMQSDSSAAPVSFVDTGLLPGRFYYYTMIVRTTDATPRYAVAGQVIVLVTTDYDYRDQLWQFLPGLYRDRDGFFATPNQPDGPLYRFMSLIGYQHDVIRSEIDSLLWVYEPDLVSGGLLPLLAQEFHLDFEPEIGMQALRRLLKNAVHLYKNRGNETGLSGLISAISNFDTEITIGKNLALAQDVSNFTQGTGTWNILTGTGTLSWNGTGTPVGQDSEPGILGLTAVGAGTVEVASGSTKFEAIPVVEGTQYTASIYGRGDAFGDNLSIRITWLDKDGAIISSSTYSTAATTTTSDWTARVSKTQTAPAGALFARIDFRFTSMTDTETQWVDGFQFEEGNTATTYEHSRNINIRLFPTRTNLATNPSFETNASDWVGVNATIDRTTSVNLYGSAAGRVTKTSGSVQALSPDTGTSGLPLFDPGDYFLSLYVRPIGVSGVHLRAKIIFYNAAGTPVETLNGPSTLTPSTDWTRLSVSGAMPATTAFVAFGVEEISGLSTSDQFRVDGVLFEKAESIGAYFDGSVGSPVEDFLWAGTPHLSQSYYFPKRTAKNSRLLQLIPKNIPINSTFSLSYLP